MNYTDAERMATVLESLGYTKTDTESEADLFIVISCSVRESAALSIYGKVRDLNQHKALNPNFKTILTGCVLEKDKKKLGRVFDVMLEMKDLGKLPSLLTSLRGVNGDEAISIEKDCRASLAMTSENYLSITPQYESTFRAYVPISTGCDNFCTYCAVPYTKGREISRPMTEIINEVTVLVEKGYKEITLLGQNVNSYGHDITGDKSDNSPFIELIEKLDAIPGDYRIYFYSNHPKDMSDKLIEALAKLKHFPHYIHLPLQSGNDEIIRAMNRHYTKEQYLDLVGKIRNVIPDVTLTTDIIVGFPGESEDQFADTVDVMKQAEYDMAFIAQYSPRAGTVSAKQTDDVTTAEKKRREKTLQEVVKSTVLKHNKLLIGTTQRVLVDEFKNDTYFGRTEGFKVVEIKTDQTLRGGQFIEVEILSASSWKLVGNLI